MSTSNGGGGLLQVSKAGISRFMNIEGGQRYISINYGWGIGKYLRRYALRRHCITISCGILAYLHRRELALHISKEDGLHTEPR